MEIRCKLKEKLEEKHITQRELSKRTGISESTISRYVNGTRKINLLNVFIIARCLGIDILELIEIKKEVEKDE